MAYYFHFVLETPSDLPACVTGPIRAGMKIGMTNSKALSSNIRKTIAENTPVRSGLMRSTVAVWNLRFSSNRCSMDAGWRKKDFPGVFYPVFVLRGTGVYGPWKRPIVAKNKHKVFVFENEAGEKIVTKEIEGQQKQRIFENSWLRISQYINSHFALSMVSGYRMVSGFGRPRGH
jgi:hypothetical protein